MPLIVMNSTVNVVICIKNIFLNEADVSMKVTTIDSSTLEACVVGIFDEVDGPECNRCHCSWLRSG